MVRMVRMVFRLSRKTPLFREAVKHHADHAHHAEKDKIMKMPNALKTALDWFARRCTQRARFEEIGQPRPPSLPCAPMALASMNTIEPLEARFRCRLSLAIKSAQLLREGKRKDTAEVVRELQNLWDGIAFVLTLFPEMANDFTVATARDIIAGRLAEVELAGEKAAHAADDDDNPEDYAPRT